MSDAPRRAGRPAMTEAEAQAMYRLARSHDGRTFLARLDKIKAKRHEVDLQLDGSDSDKNKGRIMEIIDLQREFRDAQPKGRGSGVDEQKRFS